MYRLAAPLVQAYRQLHPPRSLPNQPVPRTLPRGHLEHWQAVRNLALQGVGEYLLTSLLSRRREVFELRLQCLLSHFQQQPVHFEHDLTGWFAEQGITLHWERHVRLEVSVVPTRQYNDPKPRALRTRLTRPKPSNTTMARAYRRAQGN